MTIICSESCGDLWGKGWVKQIQHSQLRQSSHFSRFSSNSAERICAVREQSSVRNLHVVTPHWYIHKSNWGFVVQSKRTLVIAAWLVWIAGTVHGLVSVTQYKQLRQLNWGRFHQNIIRSYSHLPNSDVAIGWDRKISKLWGSFHTWSFMWIWIDHNERVHSPIIQGWTSMLYCTSRKWNLW